MYSVLCIVVALSNFVSKLPWVWVALKNSYVFPFWLVCFHCTPTHLSDSNLVDGIVSFASLTLQMVLEAPLLVHWTADEQIAVWNSFLSSSFIRNCSGCSVFMCWPLYWEGNLEGTEVYQQKLAELTFALFPGIYTFYRNQVFLWKLRTLQLLSEGWQKS